MKAPGKLIFALLFLFLAASLAAASDIYIAQNAAGGNTGSDCSNAHSAAWFNSFVELGIWFRLDWRRYQGASVRNHINSVDRSGKWI